jgi:vitamin B12 transporter
MWRAASSVLWTVGFVSTAMAAGGPVEEVVVGATKLGKGVDRLTQSVSIISEQQIEAQSFTDFTEVLRAQPGVEFKQAGGPGQFNYLRMRGFGDRAVVVVLDGQKINEASGGGVSHILGQIDPGIIERVEVLRGPQASLYGANTTAGVIAITTKSGRQQEHSVGLEFGSLDWRKASASLRDSIDAGGGAFEYSANVSKIDSDNVHPQEYYEDETLQAKVGYRTDAFQVGASFWQTDNDFQYAELDEAYCCQTTSSWWAFQTPDPNQHSATRDRVLTAFIEHELSENLSHRLQVGSMEKRYSIEDRADGLLGYQPAPYDGFRFGSRTYAAGASVPIYDGASDVAAFYKNENAQLDYNLVYRRAALSVLGGFQYLDQRAWQWGSYGVNDNDEKVLSYYVNAEVGALEEALTIGLGARLDDYDSWGEEATGNVGVAYRIGGSTTLFANYGTSFTAPSMSQLFNPTSGTTDLTPESGDTVEVGLRQRSAGGRAQWDVAAWHSKIDNVIVYDYTIANPRASSGFGQYANRDRQRTQGVELQASYALTEMLTLSANYTYTESEATDAAGVWRRTVLIARNKGNLGLTFNWDRLTLGVNALYSGPRLRWAADIENPDYVRVDVSGRYALTDRFAVFSRIENLFDREIIEDLGYEQPGLYAIVGANYNFR